MPGPLPRRYRGCTCLFLPLRHRPSPGVNGSAFFPPRCPAKRLSSGREFRSCRHFVMFRPPSLLALQVVPTAARTATGQPGLLGPSRTCFVASACIGYASRRLRPEGRGNDCLKKGANCQTCCPISTTLEGRAARQRTVLEPFDNESHSRKAGAEVARHRCICQHQRGEGPGWIAR